MVRCLLFLVADCLCTRRTGLVPSRSPRCSARTVSPLPSGPQTIRPRPGRAIFRRRPSTSFSSTWTAGRRRSTRSIPKPRLDREHGQPFKMKVQPTQFDNVGTTLKSPWKFRKRGASGIPSERSLAAHRPLCRRVVRRAVDDVAVLRAHQRQLFPAHGPRPAGTPEHGGVGDVRPGERIARSARLRRAQRRPDSARRRRVLSQRLSAGDVSGFDLPPRRQSRRRSGRAASGPPRLSGESWT